MKTLDYPCGCKFTIDDSNKVLFDPSIDKIDLSCAKTWNLISDGNTKGCFQLESRLGRTMAKKLKPSNIEELSALISIMRPGCLEAIRDGKSVSNHYIDKKNGHESIDYFHPSLEHILSNTYGEMVYQEQAMEIAKDIAGFNLQEADLLRKAIGKKKPEEMAKLKTKFISGAQNIGLVSKTQAEEIFNWIEKSQRYSFNKSHAISYAMNAYLSAYTKAHFPRIFFNAYLKYAKDKIDPQAEIKELIQNASEMDILVLPPDIRNLNPLFMLKNKKIYFGLTDIKGVGDSVFKKLLQIIESKNINIAELNWYQLLVSVLININSTAAKALISCGALDYFHKSRNQLLFEYNIICDLTNKEVNTIATAINDKITLKELLEHLLNSKLMPKRKEVVLNALQMIISPPYSLEDTIEWLSDTEYNLLGYSLTCSKIDMYDIEMTNCTCKEFKNGGGSTNILIAGEIENMNIVKTKSGKKAGAEMCFLTITDSTGVLDNVVVFPEQFAAYKNVLFAGNVIIIKGTKSKNKDSLVVEKVFLPKS